MSLLQYFAAVPLSGHSLLAVGFFGIVSLSEVADYSLNGRETEKKREHYKSYNMDKTTLGNEARSWKTHLRVLYVYTKSFGHPTRSQFIMPLSVVGSTHRLDYDEAKGMSVEDI